MLTDEEIKAKVKKNGYMSLDGEERKRYQEIKKEPEEGKVEAKKDSVKEKKEEEVTLKKSELQDMINDGIGMENHFRWNNISILTKRKLVHQLIDDILTPPAATAGCGKALYDEFQFFIVVYDFRQGSGI